MFAGCRYLEANLKSLHTRHKNKFFSRELCSWTSYVEGDDDIRCEVGATDAVVEQRHHQKGLASGIIRRREMMTVSCEGWGNDTHRHQTKFVW